MSARHGSTVPNDLSGGYSRDGESPEWSDQFLNKEQHWSSSAERGAQAMDEPARATGKANSRRKGRKKEASIIAAVCAWIVEHQIGRSRWRGCSVPDALLTIYLGLATNLLSLLVLTHLCFPRSRRQTRKFFGLSYYNASSGQCTLGWDDIFLVFYWIVIFTGLRAAVMEYLLVPLAQRVGIGKKKEMVRFAEQAWIFIYYGACWSLGMVSSSWPHCSQPQKQWLTRVAVSPLHFGLLAEPSPTLGGLAQPRDDWPVQMVLSCTICLLAATDSRRQYRGAEERLSTDVHPPCHHLRFDIHELRLPSDESG